MFNLFMKSEQAQRLSGLLRELRGDRSIRSFCSGLDLHWSAWRNWEAGESLPRLEHLETIASLRGWTLDQLSAYLRTGNPDASPLGMDELLDYACKLPLDQRVEMAKRLLVGSDI